MAVDQRWSSQKITIPAGATKTVDYDFQPDQVIVLCTTAVALGFYVYPRGAQGSAGIPLLSQGPIVFPGIEANQHLDITSLEASSKDIIVIAQKGYAPTSVVTPTTTAKPESIDVLGTTFVSIAGGASPYTFNHIHVGDTVVLWFGGDTTTSANDFNPTAVTIGGVAAVKVKDQAKSGGGEGVACSVWRALVPPSATPIQVVVTFPNTTNNIWALAASYSAAVITGNVNSGAVNAAAGLTLALNAQKESSVVFALATYNGALGTLAETAGASLQIPYGPIRRCALYNRAGKGVQTFVFTCTNPSELEVVLVELRLQ